MKKLIIMRHATAGEKPKGQTDLDRELSQFGTEQARQAGLWLKDNNTLPQLVLCSPARRSEGTCESVLEGTGKNIKVQTEKIIYHGSEKDLTQLVQEVDNNIDTVLLIGHNPSLSYFASQVVDQGLSFDPAHLAVVDLQIDNWADFRPSRGKLHFYYES